MKVEHVSRETSLQTDRIYIARRWTRHAGRLCSTCLAAPPRDGQRTCRPCHAAYERGRRARVRQP
jgi:hypothetical protein